MLFCCCCCRLQLMQMIMNVFVAVVAVVVVVIILCLLYYFFLRLLRTHVVRLVWPVLLLLLCCFFSFWLFLFLVSNCQSVTTFQARSLASTAVAMQIISLNSSTSKSIQNFEFTFIFVRRNALCAKEIEIRGAIERQKCRTHTKFIFILFEISFAFWFSCCFGEVSNSWGVAATAFVVLKITRVSVFTCHFPLCVLFCFRICNEHKNEQRDGQHARCYFFL